MPLIFQLVDETERLKLSGLPLPPYGKLKRDEEKGEFAILRAFALRGEGREQNMNGVVEVGAGGGGGGASEDENKP